MLISSLFVTAMQDSIRGMTILEKGLAPNPPNPCTSRHDTTPTTLNPSHRVRNSVFLAFRVISSQKHLHRPWAEPPQYMSSTGLPKRWRVDAIRDRPDSLSLSRHVLDEGGVSKHTPRGQHKVPNTVLIRLPLYEFSLGNPAARRLGLFIATKRKGKSFFIITS